MNPRNFRPEVINMTSSDRRFNSRRINRGCADIDAYGEIL